MLACIPQQSPKRCFDRRYVGSLLRCVMGILAPEARRKIPPQDRAMLPDIRVVTIAVISTFLFAVTVGFYTSSRLANERKPRPESLAAIEENPLNRIALNWPEPVQAPQKPLDLDFAVTSKVLRNPVRDVTEEVAPVASPAPEQRVAAAPAISDANSMQPAPSIDLPKIDVLKVEAPAIEVPKIDSPAPEPARIELPRSELPRSELPKAEVPKAELPKAELPAVTSALPVPAVKPEADLPTASIAAAPRSDPPGPSTASPSIESPSLESPVAEPAKQEPTAEAPSSVASLPEPDSEEAKPDIETQATPKIKASKAAAKKAKKKAKKAKAPPPRPRARTVTTVPANNMLPFFGVQPR